MILEHAVLHVEPGLGEEFRAAFSEAKTIFAATPGFRRLDLSCCVEDPDTYLLLVQWDTVEDHTEGFRTSEGYQQWRTLLHHFYEPFPTVSHFANIDGA
ncbi:antibiotic biosynthesis monooxygenase family protein [Rhodococcus marinonascens]|uniref:antibiotic biosynthesis monooxygenase family protein n=1 Tax=Rhodococcus marinonascens TaxID=38311 RepID=UPI0009329043|nr:antibiotic biosynthesis monooxygenase [Rhodococcus marinonascens]